MADVLLPYALHLATGEMMHVDAVPNGADCGCVCPECERPVIAVNGGDELAHHFRHEADYDRAACDPVVARETMAHRLAKDILLAAALVIAPPLIAVDGRHTPKLMRPAAPISFGGARRSKEPVLENIVPDILVEFDDRQLAIEVYRSHRSRAPKVAEFERLGMDAFEIDLSGVPAEDVDNPARFTPIVLQAARRYWLFHRDQAAVNAAYRAEIEAAEAARAAEAERRKALAALARMEAERRSAEAYAKQVEAERERLAEAEAQRTELATRRERALAEFAAKAEAERAAAVAKETEREAKAEVVRAQQRAAWAAFEARTNDRVAYLRSLPRWPVEADRWPACLCRTPFLWWEGQGWRCVTCDPPLVPLQTVRAVRGDHVQAQ